jgi:hypothetical protein
MDRRAFVTGVGAVLAATLGPTEPNSRISPSTTMKPRAGSRSQHLLAVRSLGADSPRAARSEVRRR